MARQSRSARRAEGARRAGDGRASGSVWDGDEVDDRVSEDSLMTGEAVRLDLRPTGFLLSGVGALIDVLLYGIAYVVVLIIFFAIAGQARSEDAVYGIVAILALVACLIIAPATVEVLSRGKSLGRLAIGARIVRDDGGAIGFRHAAIRSLAGMLELYGTFGALALVFGLLTPRSKRLGDLIAGTYSQYERVGRVPPPIFGMPPQLAAWAVTADVARMPDNLSRRVAQFLAQAPRLDAGRRTTQAASLAQEAAVFASPVPPVAPELFLAGVTVVRRARETEALAGAARRLATLEPALRGAPHGFPDRG